MKIKAIKPLIFSSILLMPLSTLSCSAIQVMPPSGTTNEPQEINLKFDDYFKNWKDDIYSSRNDLKTKITSVINKYQLDEWNRYYENQDHKNQKSQVLDINLSDYDKKIENDKYNGSNDLDALYRNIATSTYNDQDEQFQYLNDFINLINEENDNHEDFLYLRWKYYSIFAAKLYHIKVELPFSSSKTKQDSKEINKVTIVDWIEAISKFILETGNAEDLMKLIYSFMVYYGISPDIKVFEDYLNTIKTELEKPVGAIEKIKDILEKDKDELENKLGKDFEEKFKEFYEKVKKKWKETYGQDLSIKELFQNLSKIKDEFKDIYNEFKDVIDNWLNLDETLKNEIEAIIEEIYNEIIPQIPAPDFIYDLNFGLQNSVLHAKLCATDMMMRLANKNYEQDNKYPLWKAKRTRAIQIYNQMIEYENLLFKSLDPTQLIDEKISSIIKEQISILFPTENNPINKFIAETLTKLANNVLTNILKNIFNSLEKMLNTLIRTTLGEMRLVFIKYEGYTN